MNTRPPRTEAVSEATESAIVVSDVPVSWMPINARSHKGRGRLKATSPNTTTPDASETTIMDRRPKRRSDNTPIPGASHGSHPQRIACRTPPSVAAPTATPPSKVTLLPKWIRMSSLSVEAYRP